MINRLRWNIWCCTKSLGLGLEKSLVSITEFWSHKTLNDSVATASTMYNAYTAVDVPGLQWTRIWQSAAFRIISGQVYIPKPRYRNNAHVAYTRNPLSKGKLLPTFHLSVLIRFYAPQYRQVLLTARILAMGIMSVRPSVRPSVCHDPVRIQG